jgi:imidazoleglycerol-phosphate dehydratase
MREIKFERKTDETDISIYLNLDGKGKSTINTSIPFVDHMLALMCKHGFIDMDVQATGDIEIDYHHLMEDIGIVLGESIKKALGDKKGISRWGESLTPMDESLSQVVLDLSGRAYLVYKVTPPKESSLRNMEASLFEDFFRALSYHCGMNLHITLHYGRDLHHIFESIFKGFGRALSKAVAIDPRREGIPSTKGTL